MASHGAAIAITIALLLYKRNHPEYSFLWIIDRVAIPTAIGGSFIRFGNFFNSEIVGDYTDGSWGVVFERLNETAPRVPAQLFEGFLYVLIFIVLITIYIVKKYKPREGSLMGIFLFMMLSIYCYDFLTKSRKVDENQKTYFGYTLNHGQWLSFPFIAIALFILFLSYKYGKPKEDDVLVS